MLFKLNGSGALLVVFALALSAGKGMTEAKSGVRPTKSRSVCRYPIASYFFLGQYYVHEKFRSEIVSVFDVLARSLLLSFECSFQL